MLYSKEDVHCQIDDMKDEEKKELVDRRCLRNESIHKQGYYSKVRTVSSFCLKKN